MGSLTGKDFIHAGAKPGKWFGEAIKHASANIDAGMPRDRAITLAIETCQPPAALPLRDSRPFFSNIRAARAAEVANVNAVHETMRELMKTPVVEMGAIMPDACPAGSLGTIPVGGVVASPAIHPGMHSSDICCSVAISIFEGCSQKNLLDAVGKVTHFGPGGRENPLPANYALDEKNPFLRDASKLAPSHFATQGDGNHFAYVGTLASTGQTALVTHHGSRGPGAALYKAGMRVAERYRQALSPETLKVNAWIPADTEDGENYWAALQDIREWTKHSHFKIHDLAGTLIGAKVADRFWNEHNFVFRKSDGLFYHGKGATPAFDNWAADATDLTLIPLNMAEPVLIAKGKNASSALGFSPHGAGRNFSRTQHKRMLEGRSDLEIFKEETRHIDARFFMGMVDISELPSAYKNASAVRAQIEEFKLAEVVDEVIPYGCIMAGDWEQNAPWKQKKKTKG